ncbi:mitochondrial import receptor subunit TOM70 [Linepithema humile]|uniref:mitochondrial import receptor subunit TOM70 n=1 Tax=Linepithema humile TaxID=83485 RepID=UPI000623B6BE|nr:PREDICTED: mitochondrial import receptor subunit TOM70 [Linepithema humile]
MTNDVAGSSPLPKWQLALVVGAPVALGLGYIYYRNKNSSSSSSSTDKPSRGKIKGNTTATKENRLPEQISGDSDFDGECLPIKPQTPLQIAQTHKNTGNVQFKARNYEGALYHYNKAIEICPKENANELATFYQNRAATYEQLKIYDAVKFDCTKALELNPKYAKALLRRGRVLEQMGELEAALDDVTTACIFEAFSNQTTLSVADKILQQLGKKHAQENLANKKFIMPSKHVIKNFMTSFPNDPITLKLKDPKDTPQFLKELLQVVKDEKYDDVIPLCTKIIESPEFSELPSSKTEVLLLRATFYLLLGKQHASMQDIETILNNEDVSKNVKVSALIKRATLHMQLDNPEMAFNDFNLALNAYPTCGDIYHHRGQINLLVNKLEDAKKDFTEAMYFNPQFGVSHVQKCYTDYRLAILNREVELAEQALKDYMKIFDKFPDLPECYMLYAEMMTETEQFDKADTYFAKAIEKDPDNAIIYVHRALLQLQWTGNIELVVKYINKALELDEKCELAYESLGSLEVQSGNLERGIMLFEKALEYCRTTMELTHVYSLRDAAKTQLNIKNRLGDSIRDLFQAPASGFMPLS